MEDINLLTLELRPKKYALKYANIIKRFSLFGFLIFLLASIFVIGLISFLDKQIKSSSVKQEQLRSDIDNLSSIEHRLILIKDRLKKIEGNLDSKSSALNEIDVFDDLYLISGESAQILEAGLLKDKVQISFGFSTPSDLANLLMKLIDSGKFKIIKMNSLDYTSEKGYEISFDVIAK